MVLGGIQVTLIHIDRDFGYRYKWILALLIPVWKINKVDNKKEYRLGNISCIPFFLFKIINIVFSKGKAGQFGFMKGKYYGY